MEGIKLKYFEKIYYAYDWHCGPGVPQKELNPKVYGGMQDFISFDYYQNMLAYFIYRGYATPSLTSTYWGSKYNQFYAGDFYSILPSLAKRTTANAITYNSCAPNTNTSRIFKNDIKTFNVTIDYNCSFRAYDSDGEYLTFLQLTLGV